MNCSVIGCTRPHRSQGFCAVHYMRDRRGGLRQNQSAKGEPLAWLIEANRENTGTCTPDWPFGAEPGGYGYLTLDGVQMPASHAALILAGQPRPEPPGNLALHSCDNPRCCAHWHLRWGTTQDNTADRVERGRSLYGEHHPQATLTEADVRAIRQSSAPHGDLATEFGVSRVSIWRIINRKSWQHVDC